MSAAVHDESVRPTVISAGKSPESIMPLLQSLEAQMNRPAKSSATSTCEGAAPPIEELASHVELLPAKL